MLFKNLTLFRLHTDTAADLLRLSDVMPEHTLRDCGPLEMFTTGFVPPVSRDDDGDLTHESTSAIMIGYGRQDRMLPAIVVNDELRKLTKKIASEEDRKVGGRERKRLKDALLTDLLPRAFIRNTRTLAYADLAAGWLVIDTGSRKAGEDVVTAMREALGSFPAMPLAPEESPRVLMTDWLANGLPDGFALGDECELRDPATADGAVARCSKQDLDAEEVGEHLRNGKQVYKLGLVFDDRISFVLGADLVIRKLKFQDIVLDEIGDHEDVQREAAATFLLMTAEIDRLLVKLSALFGLGVDAPLHLHGQAAPVGMRKVAHELKKMHESMAREGVSMTITTPGNDPVTLGAQTHTSLGDKHTAGSFAQ